MHLLLTALGSYGDVLPMVGLGSAMRRRAHRVSVITNPYFRSIVEDEGLELLPLAAKGDYEKLTEHPDLWHPLRGPKLVLSYGAQYFRRLYDLIEKRYEPRTTVLAAHGLDLASRTFQEKHNASLATIHFAPLSLRSLAGTPKMFRLWTGRGAPQWLKRLEFWLGDTRIIDPIVGPSLNSLRAELGLPPVQRIYREWHNSPQLVIGLWPDWFGPPQSDWPDQTELVGFPLWDPAPVTGLPDNARKFIDNAQRPLVFSPGSANTQAVRFFQTAAEVCQRLRLRAVFATKYPEQLPAQLPPGVRHFDFLPFSQLLPRAKALVHHGGIGSCAQALAAGIPQLVMPMAYDQLDNADRLKRLGVGDYLTSKRFTPRRVAPALQRLLTSKEVRSSCREYAEKCHGLASIIEACNLLEDLDERRASAPVAIGRH